MAQPYCTNADIDKAIPTKVIIQCTDDERLADATGTLVDAITANAAIGTRLTEIIAKADTTINSYCRKRYLPPIEDENGDTPDTIRMLSVDLSVYLIHARRISEFGVPEAVEKSHNMALQMLRDIAKAIVDVGVDPPPAESSQAVATATYSDGATTERLFSDDTLEDF